MSRTQNIEHRTSNVERRMQRPLASDRVAATHSKFEVRSSKFNVSFIVPCALAIAGIVAAGWPGPAQAADEVLPKHITPETLKAVRDGLDYLARTQADDGAWHDGQGGQAYPVAMSSLACTALLAHGDSPTRARYAPQLERGTEFLIKCKTKSGLITSASQESGMPMHGHGFALMYLASVYGTLTKESLRDAAKEAIDGGV